MSTADDTEARRLAAAAGLTRLDAAQLAQFAGGAKATAELANRLPKDLHWSEEPAHVYRITHASGTSKRQPT